MEQCGGEWVHLDTRGSTWERLEMWRDVRKREETHGKAGKLWKRAKAQETRWGLGRNAMCRVETYENLMKREQARGDLGELMGALENLRKREYARKREETRGDAWRRVGT